MKVSDWCEDSLELLDLMCDLARNRKDVIRDKGRRFFSQLNYYRASAVQSSLERVHLYLMVFKTFNYQYSPVTYLFRKTWGRVIGRMKHLAVRQLRIIFFWL